MKRKSHIASLAAIVFAGWGCSHSYLAKPELTGQRLVNREPGQTSTAIGQASIDRTTLLNPMVDKTKAGQFTTEPGSCIITAVATPQVIPISEGSPIVIIKNGRYEQEDLAIGVLVGKVAIVLPVFNHYPGFFPGAGPLIILGGVYGGLPGLSHRAAAGSSDHFMLSEKKY